MATAKKTPTKKAPAKKAGKKETLPEAPNIIILRQEVVPVKSLQMYHKNPRVGNVEKIAESLSTNGQYRPLVVNVGTHTGRKNEVAAGNHTMLGARRLGWEEISVSFIDVDEDTLRKIVLVDNRAAEDGTYDDVILAELLEGVDDVIGTGFNEFEMRDIIETAQREAMRAVQEVTGQIETQIEVQRDEAKSKTFLGSELGEEPDDIEDEDVDREIEVVRNNEVTVSRGDDDDLEEAEEELSGVIDIKDELPEDKRFYAPGYWQLPALRPDMLMRRDDIPKNLKTWAGSATRDDDETKRWWLYNWGIDSTSGMQQPKSQVIVGFYCWDKYFENWFWTPKKYVVKLLNSGIKYIYTPNYSQWPNQSRFLNLWALYRSRWCGRYFQEAGLRVIPDINWPMGDNEFLLNYVLKTLPKKIPVIGLQMQTFDEELMEEYHDVQVQAFQMVVDKIKPEAIIFYAGKPGREWFEKNIKYKGEVIYLETRMKYLSEQAAKREKKKGI